MASSRAHRPRPVFYYRSIFIAAALLGIQPSGTSGQATFTVNATDDVDDGACNESHCSLREALLAAALEADGAIISFDVPGLGPHTIRPSSPLPSLDGSTTLDGATEPDFAGDPIVELDGTDAGDLTHGINVAGAGNVIRGLVINRFSGNGVNIDAEAGGNRVEGCYIGTDVTGSMALGNGNAGVMIREAMDNVVGGVEDGAGNLISGNLTNGVSLQGEAATGNTIQGNLIGTDASGTSALGNGDSGVALINAAGDNDIGGTKTGARNILSGNYFGVLVADLSVTGTRIQGNYIGTNASGDQAIPNTKSGIIVWGKETLIGGTGEGAGNVVSGNAFAGIDLGPGSAETVIQGNYVGTDASGSAAMGNALGIFVNLSGANVIGGSGSGAGNVISGNRETNVVIHGLDATGNSLLGNVIGPDATGTVSLDEGRALVIQDAPGNTIGGVGDGAGNVISGNFRGISVEGSAATGNVFQGNYIGVDATGSGAMGNRGAGIRFTNGASGNTVGGTEDGAGNIIANNTWIGVVVLPDAGTGNRILGNAIFDNAKFGIELNRDGVTPNDAGDADTGPNNLQNYPEITSAVGNGGGVIQATLNSAPSSTFTVDFFSDTGCDETGYGEGRTPLGSALLTTDPAGDGIVTVGFSGIAGTLVTATATDVEGSTSEFSACATLSTLAVSSSPETRSVTQGESAVYSISVAAQDGIFEGSLDLACSGNPAGTTCTFDEDRITLNDGEASTTMTVTTVAPAGSMPLDPGGVPRESWEYWLLAVLAVTAILIAPARAWLSGPCAPPRAKALAEAASAPGVVTILCLIFTACGDDGAKPPSGGTPPGSYSLTVTATWKSVEVTTPVTMVIQEEGSQT